MTKICRTDLNTGGDCKALLVCSHVNMIYDVYEEIKQEVFADVWKKQDIIRQQRQADENFIRHRWDSREQSGSGIFCLVIEDRTFKFSLLEQKGCDIFCNVMDGLLWTCLLFRCDSYSSYVPLRFPRSVVWFKHNQLWIPVCRLWEAHVGFLPDSECRWLSDSPCIHSHRSHLISSLKLACSIAWFVKGDFERFW